MRALLLTCLLLPCFALADDVRLKSRYDDDADTFVTTGRVALAVPLSTVVDIAGAFDHYRDWALIDINRKPEGGQFIVQLRDFRFQPGGAAGRGALDLYFDVDLVWPFGAEGEILRFDLREKRPFGTGIDRLKVALGSDSSFVDQFDLVLWAEGDENGTAVRFESRVKVNALVDPFFPLSVYRRNVEYRIAKVVRNLQTYVEQRARAANGP
ncbi:MAG: hypothetical protein KC620_16205 [Myxococcales bacterium]|nr:hypothetical protein [Myxococcales bacterium]